MSKMLDSARRSGILEQELRAKRYAPKIPKSRKKSRKIVKK